jgi:hypothetical protein
MSVEFPEGDPISWVDAADLWGDLYRFGCIVEPHDYLQFRRIGTAGSPAAAIGLQMFVQDEADFLRDSSGREGYALSVVLSADSARRLAAAILDAADEATGDFEHVLFDEVLEADDDDA